LPWARERGLKREPGTPRSAGLTSANFLPFSKSWGKTSCNGQSMFGGKSLAPAGSRRSGKRRGFAVIERESALRSSPRAYCRQWLESSFNPKR
jgi:hypothetical protein